MENEQVITLKRDISQMKKAALVTGGAKRIGRNLCLGLAQKGYDIVLHYNHSRDDAEEVKRLIEEVGQSCFLIQADLGNTDYLETMIQKSFEFSPDLTVLINNASVFDPGDFLETETAFLDLQFNINFKAPFILTREFARNTKEGIVINILDRRIDQTPDDYFAYTLSKKALAAFTRMAAKALAPGIRVNGICPGPILPPDGKDQSYMETMAESNPLKRTGSPDDILNAILFQIDNQFITGDFVYVDGGEHLL